MTKARQSMSDATEAENPAVAAAQAATRAMYDCIDLNKSFLIEAGAGAGKTHSLIQALTYMISRAGASLTRRHQQIACLTFTNAACDVIKSRIDHHPAVCTSTLHAFCWGLIKDFQPTLRENLPRIDHWAERLAEVGGIGSRRIEYDLGYPTANEHAAFLHHDDVLKLIVLLMAAPKFRSLLAARYPVLLIDEYQDTDTGFAEALKTHFLENNMGPLIGFFGDHWQQIYDHVCGKIEHANLVVIGKEANFRSVKTVVDVLNAMRPYLPNSACCRSN